MINILIYGFTGFFLFSIIITLYAISGIKYMERINQKEEDDKANWKQKRIRTNSKR